MEDGADEKLKFQETSLRIFSPPLSVAALLVAVSNREESEGNGRLDYSDLSGLEYLVWANAISAGCAVFAFGAAALWRPISPWVFFVLDQVAAYLLVSSGSAVAEIIYLAYRGDREVSWSAACESYGGFCRRAVVSLVLHFVACVCFIALSLISAYRLFARYEPPAPSVQPSKEVSAEGT